MWGLVIYFIVADAVFCIYQDAFTSTFRDVVLGTKTLVGSNRFAVAQPLFKFTF